MIKRLCIPLPVILVVLCYIVPVESPSLSGDYVLTCPTPLTNKVYNCSNGEEYHIVRDPGSGRYIERCFIPQWIPEGYETVLDNNTGNLNTEACREGTFQRHPYKSNTQCACNETKGHCNKTGQVVASNGSSTEDRTCRCDFRRGYKFSTKPSNKCICNSSSEDCTCIKEECKTGCIMSPDYKCVLENLYSTTNYTCKDYITSEESTTESVPDSDISVSLESTTESVPYDGISERMPTCTVRCYVVVIIVCIALFAIVFCVLGVLLWKKKLIKIISCICAPMRICCKKCRPFRNGSAPTNDEGKVYYPVQPSESGPNEMSPHIIIDESDDEVTNRQPSTEDNHLESGANEVLPDIKVDESNDEVTNRQPSTEDNYFSDYTESKVWIEMPPGVKMDKQED